MLLPCISRHQESELLSPNFFRGGNAHSEKAYRHELGDNNKRVNKSRSSSVY